MMTYAIFTPSGELLAYYSSEVPPTLEQMADHCAEINGFADRDEWVEVSGADSIAYAPLH
ncbi:beta-lactoglobulin I [Paraburkholderia sp. BL25I1N1]|uniref:beta-lactoglobulin I n=1 Tax=Paraburkholderia sp. BL25I1N1 TaxID=1938804 RepID=UPI000D46DEE0|nr:beta-lactoglobulin I [Paraburkholderia sp. BL25I1N1]PRY07057.1 hypothetical protein B0G73_105199 [Paraburkholderia sp. BL25I1N1]